MLMTRLTYHAAFYLAFALLFTLCGEQVVLHRMRTTVSRKHSGVLPNAYFIVRANECDGVFDFLTLFERPDVAANVLLDGIYVIGGTADSAIVAGVVRAHDLRTTVHRASAPMSFLRSALGYGNAVLVITDVHERVMVARAVPSSPTSYVEFAQLLTHTPL